MRNKENGKHNVFGGFSVIKQRSQVYELNQATQTHTNTKDRRMEVTKRILEFGSPGYGI